LRGSDTDSVHEAAFGKRLTEFRRGSAGAASARVGILLIVAQVGSLKRRVFIRFSQVVVNLVVVDAVALLALARSVASGRLKLFLAELLQRRRGVARQERLQEQKSNSRKMFSRSRAALDVEDYVTLLRKKTRPSVLLVLYTHEFVR
jgi:hypothetical protein